MYSSREDTTKRIVNALGKVRRKATLFVSTSAIGIYKAEGEHTEESKDYSNDFLGRLVLDWEHEALKARELKIRTAILRLGIGLGLDGGAFKRCLYLSE